MSLYLERAGSGPPLVLLHGFALHGGVFAPIVPALARRHAVHVVDLPGHGRSADVPAGSLEAIADAVADAVENALGPAAPPATVVGWSFGGQVAMAWAKRRPHTLARMVLACTTPSFVAREGFASAMSAETLARFGDELRVAWRHTLQRFLTLQVQGSEAGRAALAALRATLFARGEPRRDTLAHVLDLLMRTDLRPVVPSLSTPALVVAGPRDTLAPAAAGEWLAGALPHARFEAIEGAAHAPFLSHAAAFVRTVETFTDAA